jgi:transcription antitermination factor NusG
MSVVDNVANWYAVHTRSNFEARVATQLVAKGFEHYLPAYEETRQWKDRRQKINVPLFSGYVFARFHDTAEERIRVLATTGVAAVLGCGGRLEPVREEELTAVRRLLDSRAVCMPHPYLKKGDWVRVRRGPLQGLEGYLVRFKGDARLVISVSALAQSVAAELDARDVEPAKRPAAA